MTDSTIELIRLLGIAGMLGSFTIMVTDWIGWTRPMSSAGLSFDMTGVDNRFASYHATGGIGVSHGRRYWASVVGGFAMLPCGLGFVTIYVGLLPAGPGWAFLTAGLLGGIMAYGVISHTLFGAFNDLNFTREAIADDTPERQAVNDFYGKLLAYWSPFTLGLLLMQAIGSFLFSYLVLTGQSIFPTWMGLLNHFLLSQLCLWSKAFMPFAVSRWLGPPHMHLLTTLPLLALATYYTWHGLPA
ncbi:MAG: DUF6796 family protein [Pseudomonadota bacterium]